MAQPRAYTRQANFTDHTTESPSDPQVGSKLDSEFDALNLEPVMHFEEVIDYRVGQVVLHSTQ